MAKKHISLAQAFLPIAVLIPLLAINVVVFGDNSLGGANQFVLLTAAAVGVVIGIRLNIPYHRIFDKVASSISSTSSAMLILLMIGALSGTWLISGIIPALIVYGLKILNPTIFLAATTLICAVISVASGSSWSTIATIGIALLGVGSALGFSEAITAGAIISGAYFGDKMSPLSDTTNLAAAMANTDLFTHIRYMALTTVPSFGINILIFAVIGLFYDPSQSEIQIGELITAVESSFNITPLLFVVPAVVIFMIIKKVKPLPVLFIGSLLGGIFALVFQPQIIEQLAPKSNSYVEASYITIIDALTTNVSIETGNAAITDLLSSGGMKGMLNTIWLILCAMTLGGVLDAIGSLQKISASLLDGVKSNGGLFMRTVASCLFVNVTASDQYLAIVIPGKMYEEAYRNRKLAPENLSRTLEDSGTVTSVLIPWNTCGATQSTVLGVATLAYLPFCFFNYLSPLMTLFFAYFDIKIRKVSSSK
ncbi:MAG: Na+/H+ antiporter NhaC [Crocinitomicaceae bacterium]|nr:Na+/H+ antiporter NhaC [Crocinitomicaceae bacterium]